MVGACRDSRGWIEEIPREYKQPVSRAVIRQGKSGDDR